MATNPARTKTHSKTARTMQHESHLSVNAVDEPSQGQTDGFAHSLSKVSRWAARGISLVVLAIWGFFIVAHLINGLAGGGEEASRPLGTDDYFGLLAMGGWLVGLILGWRWESLGGTIVIVAFVVSAVVNPNVLSFPFLLIPTAGLLFLVSWWIRRKTPHGELTSDAPPG